MDPMLSKRQMLLDKQKRMQLSPAEEQELQNLNEQYEANKSKCKANQYG